MFDVRVQKNYVGPTLIEMEKKKIERVSYKQLTANRRIRCVNSSNTCRAVKCSNLYDPRSKAHSGGIVPRPEEL